MVKQCLLNFFTTWLMGTVIFFTIAFVGFCFCSFLSWNLAAINTFNENIYLILRMCTVVSFITAFLSYGNSED